MLDRTPAPRRDPEGRGGVPAAWHALAERFEALPGNVRGALWLVAAGLFFTAMSALIKTAGSRIPVIEILFVRQVVLCIIVWPMIARDPAGAFETGNMRLHLLRIGLAIFSMMTGFTATVYLPLADVTALGFTKGIFVTIFAILILSEKVGPHRWGATIVGFLGVFIMIRPTGEGSLVYSLMAIASAAAAGLIMVIIRRIAQREKLVTIMAYQSYGVGLALLLPTLHYWVWPSWQEAALMTVIGVASAVGQAMNICAYRVGEAAMIAPMDYLRLLYATAIGLVFFAEVPTLYTAAGAAVIVAASLYTMRREIILGRRPSV